METGVSTSVRRQTRPNNTRTVVGQAPVAGDCRTRGRLFRVVSHADRRATCAADFAGEIGHKERHREHCTQLMLNTKRRAAYVRLRSEEPVST